MLGMCHLCYCLNGTYVQAVAPIRSSKYDANEELHNDFVPFLFLSSLWVTSADMVVSADDGSMMGRLK